MPSINNDQLNQVDFGNKIKSILPSVDEKHLVVETSNAKTNQQTFSLLNLVNGEIEKSFTASNNHDGLVLKHWTPSHLLFIKFSSQKNPDQTDIFLFDWNQTEPRLSFHNSQLLAFGSDWIKIPHPHFENKSRYLNTTDGIELQNAPAPLTENKSIIFPEAYPTSSEYFSWFEQFFSKHSIIPLRLIEYLKYNAYLFISYYEGKEKELSNYLLMLNEQGIILEKFLLEQDLEGIGKDTFYVIDDHLCFISNKKTLNIYEL